MSSFNKYAIKTIQILSGSMEPKEAIALLQDANASHGVIINEQKIPVAMVVANDLKKAASRGAPFLLHPLSNLPPVVIVGSKASMQDLVVMDTTLKSFKAGARGDLTIHGDRQLISCQVTCAECGFVNELPFLDHRNLDNCQNPNVPPHTLKLS